eukprot:gene11557-13430_t
MWGYESFTAPQGVTQITVVLAGAGGGSLESTAGNYYGTTYGGYGAIITAQLSVIPGHTYYIFVGEEGNEYGGGFNGGGNPGSGGYGATGGGGATDLRSSLSLGDRLLVAGGGGGLYSRCNGGGGYGGSPSGGNGIVGIYCSESEFSAGHGGTQSNGGLAGCLTSPVGSLGQGGFGCYAGTTNGGGGGGGYYGGGGGFGAGGGGGSSYSSVTPISNYNGLNAGSGSASITYNTVASETMGGTVQYTGGARAYTVLSGTTLLYVELYGASGACDDSSRVGRGGVMKASIPVTPGEVLIVFVGGKGSTSQAGSFNGGGPPSQPLNAEPAARLAEEGVTLQAVLVVLVQSAWPMVTLSSSVG